MGIIQLLSDNLINKIAAGEVVERPASVVKELVENSLDSGATKISVELFEGGKKRILVSDNGSGMERDDAILALKRHATSKIKNDEDLFQLTTMGFRGEALASISSVSKFSLMTCKRGLSPEFGVKITCDGGDDLQTSSWQSDGGTTIIIDDLFYNIPAREKFLKSASTEYGHALEVVESIALANPWVSLSLTHNGKEVFLAPAVAELAQQTPRDKVFTEEVLRKRFSQILPSEKNTDMVFAEGSNAYGSLTCLTSAPGVEKSTGQYIYIFVNGRFVRDKGLRFAIMRGYHSHLLKGKNPVSLAFLWMDPSLVDVNVHPAKTEVRLQFASDLQGLLAMSIREALRRAEWASPSLDQANGASISPSYKAASSEFTALSDAKDESVFASQEPTPSKSQESTGFQSLWGRGEGPSTKPFSSRTNRYEAIAVESPLQFASESTLPKSRLEASWVGNEQHSADLKQQEIDWLSLEFMGAMGHCYLLFRSKELRSDHLICLDQHAFHERIIYERLCHNASGVLRESQPFLVPESLEFSVKVTAQLKELEPELSQIGFKLEFIDDKTIELRAIPLILSKSDPESLLQSIADASSRAIPIDSASGLAHDILATIACHSAVRAGEHLGESELKALLREASTVDFYHNCPHGRRVLRVWTTEQIARWFDR